MKLSIFSHTHIAVLLYLVCFKLSFFLCKGHFCYKVFEKIIDTRMLLCTTGALPSYFRDPPKWHRGSAADSRGGTVMFRDAQKRLRSYTGNAPSQTVALPGHTVINLYPKPGLIRSTAGNIWTHSNSVPIRRLQTAGMHRGVHRITITILTKFMNVGIPGPKVVNNILWSLSKVKPSSFTL